MTRLQDQQDKDDEEFDLWAKKKRDKKGYFCRLLPYNKPYAIIPFGLVISGLAGCVFPVFGIFWAKILFVMQPDILNPDKRVDMDEVWKYAFIMLGLGFIAMILTFLNRSIFGILGESMTKGMRFKLYSSLLWKHVGWYDNKEHAPGQLTSAIATEAQTLNGASTEAVAVTLESSLGLIVAVVIAFTFYWKISLVTLACAPLLVFGSYINNAASKGYQNAQEKNYWNANVLVSDSVLNYLTVASFGNEDLIVKKTMNYLWGNLIRSFFKS